MPAKILDGKFLSSLVKKSLTERVKSLVDSNQRVPGLGVILVGENPASKVYVGNKAKFAAECGFKTFDWKLPENATQRDVESVIDEANSHAEVDGILLQLPLPKGLDSAALLDRILPTKDADGLHPYNQGLLAQGKAIIKPCTPQGSLALLDLAFYEGIPENFEAVKPVSLAGKRAVVIGRSVLVGKPLGMLLLERDATVTYAHSKTLNLKEICLEADIVLAAVGRTEMVQGDWIKSGAIVIDVGMNRKDNGKLAGDVNYVAASEHASAITPVPGGVGPMTVAMLLENTFQLRAAREKA